jgi:predicted GH43/DUF377 family glycosyl hydrolase
MDPKDLAGDLVRAYNPTIFQMRNKTWMIFRYENSGKYHTALGRIELDEDTFKPVGSVVVNNVVRTSNRVTTIDDPRFFRTRGKGAICYVQGGELQNYKWSSSVCISDLDGGNFQSISTLVPAYGQNFNWLQTSRLSDVGCEKNWSFLADAGNDMLFVYNHHPFEVIQVNRQGHTKLLHKLEYENPWGRFLAGGTSFVDWDNDTLISMFHSYYKMENGQRIYDAGFMLVDKQSLKPTYISKKPIVRGWRDDLKDLRPRVEPGSPWNPVVWFPCGILPRRKDVVISFGWNDSHCGIAFFEREQILEGLIKVETK